MTRLSRQEQATILRQAFATEHAKTTAASLATMHPLFEGILKAHGAPANPPVLDFDKPFAEQSPEAKASLERLIRRKPRAQK